MEGGRTGSFCSGDAFVGTLLGVVPGSSALLQSDDTRITASDERDELGTNTHTHAG